MTGGKKRVGRPATIAPDDLVDAAERVVARGGGASLTFDAVAREAGVSKGAVLHHFSTKDAMLVAMIERLAEREAAPALADAPSQAAAVRAHVARATETPGDRDPVSATLLAAIAADIALLAPLRQSAEAVIRGLTDAGIPAERAAIVHFALDGLWIAELLGISPLTPTERERLIAALPEIATPKDTA